MPRFRATLFLAQAAILVLLMVITILIILPRQTRRQIRHRLADFVLWQWIKGSAISARAHHWLWREGNGHGGTH